MTAFAMGVELLAQETDALALGFGGVGERKGSKQVDFT